MNAATAKSELIVTLALSPSVDVTYEVDRLRLHEITRPTAVTRVAGGKALNVARVAAALGGRVHTVAALGGHDGARIEQLLAADGISATVTRLRRNTRTSIAVVDALDSASSTDLYEPATALDPPEWDAFARAAQDAVGCGDRVAFSGSLPAGVSPAQLGSLFAQVHALGAWVAVDSSGVGLRASVAHCDLVKVNRAEAIELLHHESDDRAALGQLSAEHAARAIRELFEVDAIVTDGVAGGFALLGDEHLALPVPTALGRFSAGSGDAFFGGLLVGLQHGRTAAEAVQLAAAAAQRNALVAGQGILATPDRGA